MYLAVDIDDTLCQTTLRWMRLFQEHFGNPEGLTAEQLVEKYEIVQYVPYRQTPEADKVILDLIEDDRNRLELVPIPGAQQALQTLKQYSKILYLTSRTEEHRFKTMLRLENHNFPELELIMRPNASDAYTKVHTQFTRKAQYLMEQHPHISGIIDNSASLAIQLQELQYPGINILYGHQGRPEFPEKHQLHSRAEAEEIIHLFGE